MSISRRVPVKVTLEVTFTLQWMVLNLHNALSSVSLKEVIILIITENRIHFIYNPLIDPAKTSTVICMLLEQKLWKSSRLQKLKYSRPVLNSINEVITVHWIFRVMKRTKVFCIRSKVFSVNCYRNYKLVSVMVILLSIMAKEMRTFISLVPAEPLFLT